eukprot:g1567.t1
MAAEPDLLDDPLAGSDVDVDDADMEPTEPEMTSEEVKEALVAACKSSDAEQCRAMLDKLDSSEVEEMATAGRSWTPLTHAASEGAEDIVDMLLERGFGAPFGAGGNGEGGGLLMEMKGGGTASEVLVNSPLLWAAYKGHEPLLCRLIRAGFDGGARDGCGNTALHLAATAGHAAVVRTLLGLGADVRARNAYGNSALKMATDAEVRDVLSRAESQAEDPITGEPFGRTGSKLLCLCCDKFYKEESTVAVRLLRAPGTDDATRRPARLSLRCRDQIDQLEDALRAAMKRPDGDQPMAPGAAKADGKAAADAEIDGGDGGGAGSGGAAKADVDDVKAEAKGEGEGEGEGAAEGKDEGKGEADEGEGKGEGKGEGDAEGGASGAEGKAQDEGVEFALSDDDVEPLAAAVAALGGVGADGSGQCADADLLLLGRRVHSQLVARLRLRDELAAVNAARPLKSARDAAELVAAIEGARAEDFDGALRGSLAEAERVVRASAHEIRLERHVADACGAIEAAGEEHAREIARLDALIGAVREERALETELGGRATRLLTRLRTEVALGQLIAASSAAREAAETEEARVAAQLEEIEGLKGKKKKVAKKAFEAEQAAVTAADVQLEIDGLDTQAAALDECMAAGADEALGVNASVLEAAAEEKRWLKGRVAVRAEVLGEKQAAEEKALAKKNKKKK